MIQERNDFYRVSNPGILVTLSGTDHNSFTDMAVIKAIDRQAMEMHSLQRRARLCANSSASSSWGGVPISSEEVPPKYPIATVEFSASSDPSDAPH